VEEVPFWTLRKKVNKAKISYYDIDLHIRRIIKLFNKIPWLATTSCCEGHPLKRPQEDYEAIGAISLEIYDEEKWRFLLALFDLERQANYEFFNIAIEKTHHYSPRKNCIYFHWRISWIAGGLTKKKTNEELAYLLKITIAAGIGIFSNFEALLHEVIDRLEDEGREE